MALVEVRHLVKQFPVKAEFRGQRRVVHAVDDVSFDIENGKMLALVGESGCGKTTTGRLILRLLEPTSGTTYFEGENIYRMSAEKLKQFRCKAQIIFQDPFASLNPRKTIGQLLSKPLRLHNVASRDDVRGRVVSLLETVGLTPAQQYLDRYPHEFSGGQRQRIGVARAISLNPKFIVADEPVSALDMSVRAQILNLLKELRRVLRLTSLFISHDLSVVRSMADVVAVMYLGKIVEVGNVEEFFVNALHPYSKAILSATPIPNPRVTRSFARIELAGDVPSPIKPPSGCRFHSRCPMAFDRCAEEEPQLIAMSGSQNVACHLYN
jgi:oligopeptide/dipeptide ABC transporter ATP-binding protein